MVGLEHSLWLTSYIVECPVTMFLFCSGAKIHRCGAKTRCIEEGGASYTLEEGSEVPAAIAQAYQHAEQVERGGGGGWRKGAGSKG